MTYYCVTLRGSDISIIQSIIEESCAFVVMEELGRTGLLWYRLEETIMRICEGQHGVHQKRVLNLVSLGNRRGYVEFRKSEGEKVLK